ncbi:MULTISPECIES: nitrite reductase small subunit NirD [unclassified Arthrobacter]|uniref:nitrite reductase small subunit NirD n=1 Tax=unclassified Arthrobacter TaxID=235627 RepID=UPI0003186E67|nr:MULTISPECIES: nitrite reductase small subunit NirD [unclassified Arthrobacter]PVE19557.1 nitrite reductase (NAD(P)H) small subunit [Arthrobacter sp. Bz4]
MTELILHRPAISEAAVELAWEQVCRLDDLEECWGEAALVGTVQVALFRLPGDRLHAVGNIDPRTGAAVMARGIIGSRGAAPTVASPLHKEVYDLATGASISGGQGLRTYPVRCVDGVVELFIEVGFRA